VVYVVLSIACTERYQWWCG